MVKIYLLNWTTVRVQADMLREASLMVAMMANDPAKRDSESVEWVTSLHDRSSMMLSKIAETIALDSKPIRRRPKVEGTPSAVELPGMVDGGCPLLYAMALTVAELSREASRLGLSKSTASIPGAMAILAEKAGNTAGNVKVLFGRSLGF